MGKRQETEYEGEGEGKKGEEGGVFVPGDKGLTLDTEETGMAHRHMVVYKGKGRTLCWNEVFNFTWVC